MKIIEFFFNAYAQSRSAPSRDVQQAMPRAPFYRLASNVGHYIVHSEVYFVWTNRKSTGT
jgi:hypothetical protein